MRIVIDTNVVISAIFFKGKPFYILKKVVEHSNDIEAFASPEILSEYNEIYKRMIEKRIERHQEGIHWTISFHLCQS